MKPVERLKRPSRRIRVNGDWVGGSSHEEPRSPSKDDNAKSGREAIETPDGLMNEVAAAAFLTLKVSTLQNKRSKGEPPEFIKLGRRVFYKREDLERFNEERLAQRR